MNDTIKKNPCQLKPADLNVLHLAQITDCHIFASTEDRLLGLNTRHCFEAVSKAIMANCKMLDLLLATGDLSQDGSPASYQYLANQFDAMQLPVFWIPGNHDESACLIQHFKGEQIHPARQVLIGEWQIVLLDSTIAGEVFGRVSEYQLEFLDSALQDYPNRHTLVCLHHQALDSGSEWLDQKGLRGSHQLRARLAQHSNLRGVLWGHVHQETNRVIDGVTWMSTPSTCVQFKPGSKDFATDSAAPGYRHLSLYPDGSITSMVHRVEQIDPRVEQISPRVEQSAKGY